MECEYEQTNDLDYASPEEKAEYDRYIDIIQAMIDNTTPDFVELQERPYVDHYDECADDEDLSDCRRRW